jgi:predicted transcriptional regulator
MSQFTDGELKVMRILWEHGELKPAQIQEEFPEPIKNPALRSYLTILVEKGHVTRRLSGKAFYYQAKTPVETAMRAMYRQFVNTFFKGSAEALICHLIKDEKLDEEDLRELQRAASGATEPPPQKGRSK